ncbi:hypothetical protein BDD12DRAFT_804404 [Trichophaea hybrida]|nr:hypothetical protein BDD12DRAFT_804404 [Trichophaea hybrida]
MKLSAITSLLVLGATMASAIPAGRDRVVYVTKYKYRTVFKRVPVVVTRTIEQTKYIPKPPKSCPACVPSTITSTTTVDDGGKVCTTTTTATTTSVTVATTTTTETVHVTDTAFTTETTLITNTATTTVTTTAETCTPTSPSECTATSPVGNPGFEETDHNSAPWVETDSQGQGEGVNVPLDPHSGSRNFRLRIPGNAPPEFAYITIGQPLTLCKDVKYNFSAWVRNPILGSLCFATFKIGGNTIAVTDGTFNADWSEVTATYTPAATCELLEITVKCPGNPVNNGEQRDLFLDDVTLTVA